MNALLKLLGGGSAKATTAALDTAEARAADYYRRYETLILLAAFMAVTVWVFYFFPRFVLPWRRPS